MTRMKSLLGALLAVSMIFTFAACDKTPGNTTSNNSGTSATSDKGVRYDANGDLLYKPEDVGALDNPIVHGIIAPPPDDEWYAQEIKWREDAYDLEYDYDTAPWTEREMKWIASYVSGTPYDIITYINYPTTVVKGLVQPLDDILPLDDSRYFNKKYSWKGKTYGVNPIATGDNFYDVGEVHGVWFNQDLFDDYGLTSPVDLWENGQWDFDHFIDAAKALTVDSDKDGKTDIYGWTTWYRSWFTAANGTQAITMNDNGISLTWTDPAFIHAMEYYNKAQPYFGSNTSFEAGTAAMYIERVQCARTFLDGETLNFTADWVPLPKGPDGEGYLGSVSTGTWTSCIGSGAKNIEGAKVFICADICRFDYVPVDGSTKMMNVTDEIVERAKTCDGKFISDLYRSIGSLNAKMYNVLDAIPKDGVVATLEKYTNVFQAEIDTLMAEKEYKEQGEFKAPNLDFEDGAITLKEVYEGTLSITEDPAEVISGSKSLKIQLKADNEYGPVAVTTPETTCLPFGGQYKLTLKAKAVGGKATEQNTLLVSFRPYESLETKDTSVSVGGFNPIDLTSGEVVEFECMINVNDYYDDLELFIIGNTDEAAPDLALIIDDIKIEKIG
ncbi:MAG TPA: hypothetical protein DCE08_04540 [Ruminococcaceae bacterium]|nr:hypothetical protein [Oscillospiraceae bacterium]